MSHTTPPQTKETIPNIYFLNVRRKLIAEFAQYMCAIAIYFSALIYTWTKKYLG